jgi:hypothetical protein
MVYVSPLSPCSCEVTTVGVVATNEIVRKISTIVA